MELVLASVALAAGIGCGGLAVDCDPDKSCEGPGSNPLDPTAESEMVFGETSGSMPASLPGQGLGQSSDPLGSEAGVPDELEPFINCPLTGGLLDQAAIDALRGCQVIEGSLFLAISPGIDLSPLSEVELVLGEVRLFAGSEQGPSSIVALQKLRRAWSLTLEGLKLTELELPSLQRLQVSEAEQELAEGQQAAPGSLRIEGSSQLRSLSGLSQLRELTSLVIRDNESLVSLAGPRLAEIANFVAITDNPNLVTLGPAWPTTYLAELEIDRANLEELEALSNVQQLASVLLYRPGPLPNLLGLRSLQTVGTLRLRGTQLRSLDGLEALRSAGVLSVASEAKLQSMEAVAGLATLGSLSLTNLLVLEASPVFDNVKELRRLQLRHNSALLQAPQFPQITQLDVLLVDENDLLLRIAGLSELRVIGSVNVTNNRSLSVLDLPSLVGVGGFLTVTCNESLPEDQWGPLRNVSSGGLSLTGNRGRRSCR